MRRLHRWLAGREGSDPARRRARRRILGAVEAILILTVVVIAIDRYSVQVAARSVGAIRR